MDDDVQQLLDALKAHRDAPAVQLTMSPALLIELCETYLNPNCGGCGMPYCECGEYDV